MKISGAQQGKTAFVLHCIVSYSMIHMYLFLIIGLRVAGCVQKFQIMLPVVTWNNNFKYRIFILWKRRQADK